MDNFSDKYSLEQLRRLAFYDELTGLYNRRYFKERLLEEQQRAKRYQRPLSIIMLDVDHFKGVNDTYGHLVGDEILKIIANILRKAVRDTDVIFRYAGDEFIVILPESDKEGSITVAERMVEFAKESEFFTSKNQRVTTSISVGVASFPEDTDEPTELTNLSDIALYNAKKMGRGCASGIVNKENKINEDIFFIGREKELGKLTEIFEKSLSENGQMVLLKGDLGIGRTTLLFHFKEQMLKKHRFTILRGQNYEEIAPVSYQPFREAFTKFLEANEILFYAVLNELNDAQIFEFNRLLPGLKFDLSKLDKNLSEESDEFKLFSSVYFFLSNLSKISPIIFIIEDLQWSDLATLDMLTYLVRNLSDKKIMFCATLEEATDVTYLTNSLKTTGENFGNLKLTAISYSNLNSINLNPFTKEETEKFLVKYLAPKKVYPKFVMQFYSLTNGIPMFVKELADYFVNAQNDLLEINSMEKIQEKVPLTIKEAINKQISNFETELIETLEIIAIIGNECSFELFSNVAELDEGRLFDTLEKLTKNKILVETVRGKEEHYSFRYLIAKELIYEKISHLKRKKFHLKTAKTIEKLYFKSIEKYYEQLANHYFQAKVFDKALDYAIKSAQKSKAIYSNEIALKYFEMAKISLDFELEDNPNNVEILNEKFNVMMDYVKILGILNKTDKLSGELDKILEVAKKLKDKAKISDVYLKMARFYLDKGEIDKPGLLSSMALNIKRETKDFYGEAVALRMLGNVCYRQNLYESALEYYNLSLQIANQINNLKLKHAALGNIGLIYEALGDYSKAVVNYSSAFEIVEVLGDKVAMEAILFNLASCESERGNFEKAISLANESIKISKSIVAPFKEATDLLLLCTICTQVGFYENALEIGNKALETFKEMEDFTKQTETMLILVDINLMINKLDDAEAMLKKIELISKRLRKEDISNLQIKWAEFYENKGDFAKALGLIKSLKEAVDYKENADLIDILTHLVRISLSINDLNEAITSIKILIDYWEEKKDSIFFYENCFLFYQVYSKSNDTKHKKLAKTYLETAYKKIKEIEDKFVSKELKNYFIQKTINQKIINEWQTTQNL
ncbi:diguanylate cyclase [bacterium]|nr:diguanylate cyclase [bacterium]